jgi:hypothetical protein
MFCFRVSRMPRAPFDDACDLYYGPLGASPGVKWANAVPCRRVPLIPSPGLVLPFNKITAYVTLDQVQPNGPVVTDTGTAYNWVYGYSDRLAIPTGVAPNWQLEYVEQVVYRNHPAYWRAWVSPIPPVPPSVIVWYDTFTEVSNTLLSVHVPQIGTGGYSIAAFSFDGTVFGGNNWWMPNAPSTIALFNPGVTLSSASLRFSNAIAVSGTQEFWWRCDATGVAQWVNLVVSLSSVTLSIQDGSFAPQTSTLSSGNHSIVITDDGLNITCNIDSGAVVLGASSPSFAANTVCKMVQGDLNDRWSFVEIWH